MTVVNESNAIAALGASADEADMIRRAWAKGGRARNAVEQIVRARCLRLLVEGPPGSGKTTATQRLAGSLSGGLDVVDVDRDVSDAGSDSWRTWPVSLPAVTLPPGKAGKSGLRAAAQAAYDAAWGSLVVQTSAVAAELREGRSSGVVLDTATSLVTYLMDTASAASEDLGADDDDRERMAADRYRGALYKAASTVSGQVWNLASEGVWTAPAGPVVGVALAHAKPVTDQKTREFKGWGISLGPQAANEIRGRADFIVACGMDASERPGIARARFYAHVDEAVSAGAKARWSLAEGGGKVDEAERGPALAALRTLDLASFARHIVAHRRALGFARLERVLSSTP